MKKYQVLKEYFGHDSFREGQEAVVDNLLNGRDCFAIMPTGKGKSLCYQLPGVMSAGVSIIISPLISLMKDQVDMLNTNGIQSAYLNSSLSDLEFRRILAHAYAGNYKFIYVAPERLLMESFIKFSNAIDIDYVIIDEAHCVSLWGSDFRKSYLNIPEYISKLAKRPIMGAFTATATKEIRDDVITLLNLNDPYVEVTSFNRENLYYSIEYLKEKEKNEKLITYLKNEKDNSGIIYCQTIQKVDETHAFLVNEGYNAVKYHSKLSSGVKQKNQEAFQCDEAPIMVATCAFGMGINKSNVRFIIHYNMPSNIEAYYQETGRAGRDGLPSRCYLFYNGGDYRIGLFLLSKINNDTDEDIALDEEKNTDIIKNRTFKLRKMYDYCQTSHCLRHYLLAYFGEKSKVVCENCLNCQNEYETIDVSEVARKIIAGAIATNRNRLIGEVLMIDMLRGSKNQKVLRLNLDRLPVYNTLGDYSSDYLREIFYILVEEGYLQRVGDEYPVIKVSEEGNIFYQSDLPLTMKKLKPKEAVQKPSKKVTTNLNDDESFNKELYFKLKDLRIKIARENKVPAYLIFNDATLVDMARKCPVNEEEFLQINGVGEYKCKRFGTEFLELINSYLQKV